MEIYKKGDITLNEFLKEMSLSIRMVEIFITASQKMDFQFPEVEV